VLHGPIYLKTRDKRAFGAPESGFDITPLIPIVRRNSRERGPAKTVSRIALSGWC
jgi:hypothetical protein